MLEGLGAKELELMKKIHESKYYFDEYNLRVNGNKARDPEKPIYEEYEKIYSDYLAYYKATNDLEALKRALFIQWYSVAEPGPLSGIGDIPHEKCEEVFGHVCSLIASEADIELKMMLSLMIDITEWFFDEFENGKRLRDMIGIPHYEEIRTALSGFLYSNRGQMGYYFGLRFGEGGNDMKEKEGIGN